MLMRRHCAGPSDTRLGIAEGVVSFGGKGGKQILEEAPRDLLEGFWGYWRGLGRRW